MKSSLIFLFSLFTAGSLWLVSCEPDPGEPKEPAKASIMGNWQWVNSISGWGGLSTPSPDSTVILKFNADSSYAISLNNQVKYTGPVHSFIAPYTDSLIVLNFDRNMSVHLIRIYQQSSITYFKNDTLRLYDYPVADGSSHLFIRKP
ncbi:MAG: hypothetical protein IPP73_11725 [Chitinophagaceae bacterium]|nr:hypothetical protein [Chitinophagaceae bacterium]